MDAAGRVVDLLDDSGGILVCPSGTGRPRRPGLRGGATRSA